RCDGPEPRARGRPRRDRGRGGGRQADPTSPIVALMPPSHSGKARLCLAAAATGLLFALAPVSPAAAGGFVGINEGSPLDQADLQKIADTGVRSDRFILSWAAVQPSEGAFNWGATDRMVGGSASRGIRALPILWGSPRWAASSPARPPIDTPSARHAWRGFLEAA